jgi:hypothetical protein
MEFCQKVFFKHSKKVVFFKNKIALLAEMPHKHQDLPLLHMQIVWRT